MNGQNGQRIVFVSGLSGSGKTTAMAALEDLSFYCVDGLPVQLVPQFLDLCTTASVFVCSVSLPRPPVEVTNSAVSSICGVRGLIR